MQTKLFPSLMLLLGFTTLSNAQYGQCDYEQIVEVGKIYSIFSPNYPFANYDPGTNCRWIAKSDRPLNLTCTDFQIPESQRCGVDVVVIQSSSAPGQPYCGTGTFTIISEGNQIITELHSSPKSPGGRFLCSLQAMNTISDEDCRCGWKNPTRIIGGDETGVNEYPMMAGLVNFVKRIVFCGATIINAKQVITAAHCVDGMDYRIVGVLVGEHDTKKGDETQATQLHTTTGFIIHPQYSETTQEYDIAIVNVETVIIFNQLVGPACLPFQHAQDSFAGNYVDILGWGSIGTGEKMSDTLQVVRVPVITNRECSKSYPKLTSREMCTLENGKDACQFDSGGPVLWTNPATRKVVFISFTIYGQLCGDGTPAVNSRVGPHIDWILKHAPQGWKYCESE